MPSFAATWIAWAIHEPVIIRCSVVAAESSTEMIGSDMHAAPSGGQAHHCDGLAPYAERSEPTLRCALRASLRKQQDLSSRHVPKIRDALLHLRFIEDSLYIGSYALAQIVANPLRTKEPEPASEGEFREPGLRNGWHVRSSRRTLSLVTAKTLILPACACPRTVPRGRTAT